MFATWLASFHRLRFAWLFAALLATLGARPVLEGFGSSHDPFDELIAICLGMAAVGLARDRGKLWLIALTAAFVALYGVRLAFGVDSAHTTSGLLWAAGFVLAIVACVRHALAPGRVDRERIFAALDAYLLAGLLFAGVYRLLDSFEPGSFTGAIGENGLDIRNAIYLSFVTIVSLGYGDIVPRSEAARGVVIVEAIGGQMYLAVLLARLVSLYSRQHDPE